MTKTKANTAPIDESTTDDSVVDEAIADVAIVETIADEGATEATTVDAPAVTFGYTCEGTSGVTRCTATLGDASISTRFAPDSPELRERVEQNLAARLRGETTDAPSFGVVE